MLAGKETTSYTPVQYIAGDAPGIATENGTLASGQNLPVRSVLGRVAGTKKLVLCDPAAADGSQVAVGVLVHATDATAADKAVQYYKAGCFFAAGLNWHVGFDTVDKKKAALDGSAIVIK